MKKVASFPRAGSYVDVSPKWQLSWVRTWRAKESNSRDDVNSDAYFAARWDFLIFL